MSKQRQGPASAAISSQVWFGSRSSNAWMGGCGFSLNTQKCRTELNMRSNRALFRTGHHTRRPPYQPSSTLVLHDPAVIPCPSPPIPTQLLLIPTVHRSQRFLRRVPRRVARSMESPLTRLGSQDQLGSDRPDSCRGGKGVGGVGGGQSGVENLLKKGRSRRCISSGWGLGVLKD